MLPEVQSGSGFKGPRPIFFTDSRVFSVQKKIMNNSNCYKKSKAKIWWLELHPHLIPTTPNDVSVLASLLSHLDADGVLFDNYGRSIGVARGENLEALINTSTELLNKSTQTAGQNLDIFTLLHSFLKLVSIFQMQT